MTFFIYKRQPKHGKTNYKSCKHKPSFIDKCINIYVGKHIVQRYQYEFEVRSSKQTFYFISSVLETNITKSVIITIIFNFPLSHGYAV